MAEFRIDQATPGAGVPGRTRHDLVPGEVITLVATSPVGPGITYTWEILDKVGSVAVLSSTTGQTVEIGPAASIVRPCSFRIRLTANNNGVITTMTRRASVRTAVTGLFVPLFPESAPTNGTLASNFPDASEDNAVYTNRAGLGVAEQNWRGWAEWAYEMVLAVERGGGAGGPPTGPAGGDLGGTYPNPDVTRLRGRMIENVAPNNNDYLRWDSGTMSWRPTAFPTGLPPIGAAGGDLTGNYPNPQVVGLHGIAVQSGTPTVNDILRFDGTDWKHHYQGNFIDGTAAQPAIYFGSDPDTGVYKDGADAIGVTSGGTRLLKLKRPLFAASGTEIAFHFTPDVGGISGTAGYDVVLIDVQGAPTGSGERNILHFTEVGAERFQLKQDGQLRAIDGAVATPSYSFINDPDSGLFSQAADQVSVATGGAEAARFSSQGILSGTIGAPATPSISFVAAPTYGIYYGGGEVRIAVGGNHRWSFGPTSHVTAAHIIPGTTDTYDLGTSSLVYRAVYATTVAVSGSGTFADGTVSAPSITFTADSDTGFWRPGNGIVGVAGDGLEVVRFQAPTGANPQVLLATGSATRPSLSFSAAPTHGLFYDAGGGQVAFVHSGATRMLLSNTSLAPNASNAMDLGTSGAPWRIGLIDTVRAASGTVTAPTLSFQTETDTGFWLQATDNLSAAVSGNEVVRFSSPAGTTPQILAAIGSGVATAPSYSFINNTDTGIFHPTGNAVGIASAGGEIARFTRQTSVTDTPQILMAVGISPTTNPQYSFLTNTDTGMAFDGSSLSFYVDGVLPLTMSGVAGVPRAQFAPGSAANPSITFQGATTTGFFEGGGGGTVGITTGGVERVRFTGTASTLSTHWYPDISNTRDLGAPSQRWNLVYAARFDGFTGRFQTVQVTTNGTASAPSITWLAYADNGFFNISSDTMGATVDGVEVMRWQNVASTNPKTLIPDGSPAHPSLGFINDANTGLYRIGADSMGVAAGGTEIARFVLSAGPAPQMMLPEGSLTNPSLAWINNADTGLVNTGPFGAPGVGIVVDGVLGPVVIATGGPDPQLGLGGGDVSLPALYVGNGDTGLFSPGSNTLGVSANGTEITRFLVSAATAQIQSAQGSAAVPIYSFAADPDTGLYNPGPDQLAVTAGGAFRANIASTQITTTVPLRVTGGTAGAPGYAFNGDPKTGMYLPTTDQVGFATAGVNRLVIGTASIDAALVFRTPDGSASVPAISFTADTGSGIYRSASNEVAIASAGMQVGFFKYGGASNAGYLKMNGNVAAGATPETNALYAKNIPKAWLKAVGLTGIDDSFGVASLASDGGTPAATIVTFHHSAGTSGQQAIVVTSSGTTATTARFCTVDNFAVNSCRVRNFQWNGNAIVQVPTGGEWSLQRFATVS